MAVSTLLVLAYVVATRPNPLTGDQSEWHTQALFFADGKLWWSDRPFGIAEASTWRTPLYTAWVGIFYAVSDGTTTIVLAAQALLAAVTVALSWALARRLFGPKPAIATAFVVATFPLVWEWFGLLYTEALAIPLTMLALLLFLERPPTPRLAIALGAVMGVGMLVRPSAFFLFAGVVVAWVVVAGLRRSVAMTALAIGVAALIVLPWTVRNYFVADGFVPISMQDMAVYGTFNEVSANDPVYPYAWRAIPTPEVQEVLDGPPLTDAEFRSEMMDIGYDYVREHPLSVAEAFFWNGLSRFWDVRRPSRALDEVPFEGRSEAVTAVGLGIYYALLPLALFALWRHRRRLSLVLPVLAIALAASIVFTTASGTRYRAPLEPLIAMLAVAAFVRPARSPAEDPRERPQPAAVPAGTPG